VFENDKELQHIIHSLKYDKKFKVGIYLGELLADSLKQLDWRIDLIIPVPIHHLKKAERGYNQSDFIAKGLSKALNVPGSTKTVKRIRYTETQTDLNLNERAKNVEKAFKLNKPNAVKGKNILLVDDVITTGATILECAKILVNAGAKTVYACSVGIAE
jgi:ComF family protein